MDPLSAVGLFVLGAVLGAAAAWAALRQGGQRAGELARAESAAELARTRQELADSRQRREELAGERDQARLARQDAEKSLATVREDSAKRDAELEETRKRFEEQERFLDRAKAQLGDAFKALSGDALTAANERFLTLAQERLGKRQEEAQVDLQQRHKAIEALVTPVRETLAKHETLIHDLEKQRREAYGKVQEMITGNVSAVTALRDETKSLVTALRNPGVKGRWGEMQLRNLLELSGMSAHVDFEEQVDVGGEEGRFRPDAVIRLPGERRLPVDSKAVLDAFLEAQQAATPELQNAALERFGSDVAKRIKDLAKKEYWAQFSPSPTFVVLFLPGEALYAAAVKARPTLIDEAWKSQVHIASPMTLLSLFRVVAEGWRVEAMAANAQVIAERGAELHDRLTTWSEHLESLGKALGGSVTAYNKAVGSLERTVLPSARRMKELGVDAKKTLPDLSGVEVSPRALSGRSESSPSLLGALDEARKPAIETGSLLLGADKSRVDAEVREGAE